MIHPPDCDCGAYACDLRAKGVQVSPAGMVKHNGKPPSKPRYNNWEKGRAGEKRAGGSFMPYLDKTGTAIPIKKYSQGDYAKGKKALDRLRATNTQR